LVAAVGVDPVHFGIILVANLCVGALTPPLGMLIFTSARVTGTPVPAVFREALPFVAGLICAIFVITFWPALSLWLVRAIGP
jgi:C4-dicarboxylate transporter DctM subunit